MAEPAERLAVGFARLLRGAGLDVPTGATIVFTDALAAVGVDRRDGVYWTARATLLRTPADRARFDACFDAWWLGATEGIGAPPPAPQPVLVALDDPELPSEGEPAPPGDVRTVRWSGAEVLRAKDFAACDAGELEEAARLMASLRLGGARRRSRRLRPSGRRGSRPDLRGTVRAALRTDGEAVRPARRSPATRPRRVVLLVDVSGSMEPYARALLRFLHAAVAGRQKVEAFTLGTRLTRLTRELSTHDPDAALTRAAGAVPDWSGGTRLGEGLRAFNDTWGVRGMARGAVVVILSDGWDRGDPAVLGEQVARLSRVAHRVVWANPLKATPGYEPLAAGMAAALPYVDEFVEAHCLDSLATLADVVAKP
jgi:uncharacterized protein with von Willebrand factor type A (vWA) domain